jgi:hypothetical protein
MLDESEYKDSLVAFIDILGFDSRVRNIDAEESFFEISKLLVAIKETADNISGQDGIFAGYKVTAISDSVIATVPFTDPICTYGMLIILQNMQYDLLATGFKTMVRGYITRGKVYHKNGYIFGPGYSEAYRGENEYIGKSPRIVLDPAIVEDAKRVIDSKDSVAGYKTIFDLLVQDSDGFHFIDFLSAKEKQSSISDHQYQIEKNSIKAFAMDGVRKYSGNIGIWAKYQWLLHYANQKCS